MRSKIVTLATIALSVLFTAILVFPGCSSGDGGDFCEANCPAVVAAGCSNGPADQADCLTGCNTAQTTCPSQFNALAGCAGTDATFSCDAYDSPAPAGCVTENTLLNACLQGVSEFCVDGCPAVLAAACSNGPSDLADCLSGCDAAATSCPTEFTAMQTCAGASAAFACDANNAPYPTGCQAENDALMLCMQ
ncbi:MAG TPA: hypothetical protein VM425_08615 [Myxococcota bacterium]|nr:hypothetical protein [Myxococcota bacterium]